MGPIFGVKKINKKATEFFVGIEEQATKFSSNPMHGFTSSDKSAVNIVRDILSAGDKRNQYEVFEVKIC
jgi:hypothetical protein